MNATTLLCYVGKYAAFHTEGMRFTVKTLDAKSVFGKVLVLVTPPWEDCGTKWVDAERLTLGESY